uniref:G-protein coupled receptors family 2 profile 1 domain-containing protein n=1 Tax=Sphenodon punctatus TaxID=8508 RepID=A0A8D0G7U9_SPHPU
MHLINTAICTCIVLFQGAAGSITRSDVSLSSVMQKWKEYQLQCLKYLYETPPLLAEGKFCNGTFDDYACWPDGLPGTYVNVSCPWYLPWASTVLHGHVYRFCTPEGTWLLKENSTLPWRNLSECEASDRVREQVLSPETVKRQHFIFCQKLSLNGFLQFAPAVLRTQGV